MRCEERVESGIAHPVRSYLQPGWVGVSFAGASRQARSVKAGADLQVGPFFVYVVATRD